MSESSVPWTPRTLNPLFPILDGMGTWSPFYQDWATEIILLFIADHAVHQMQEEDVLNVIRQNATWVDICQLARSEIGYDIEGCGQILCNCLD
ncbi:uncharacterized protein BDCG_16113 [Blastomyces dermatitidis ER-3]|uniref:Uncharacterized protein n=3 Tax=Blastomyces TaxID=229219 RepID=A0A179UT01_BLAGS|nr:uncharacterized protein BDBG_17477 [Blastomyces gilchristii SLH14081]XP_045279141.1 uncharacterized protein BDCG_16113 [Blastomyces dermatitidis ER-3]KMW68708.1 hypothetical protein BDDG_12990 [Blastomyces dermatitidis ATCC 18188]OAS99413.1 hypothetical protein BDCG_16113 [Blastomyces dermatitidis ER-3]OAT11245.1 hypothetical protein BDBG_17477 [Blastomyces gilchristii SLH14081]